MFYNSGLSAKHLNYFVVLNPTQLFYMQAKSCYGLPFIAQLRHLISADGLVVARFKVDLHLWCRLALLVVLISVHVSY